MRHRNGTLWVTLLLEAAALAGAGVSGVLLADHDGGWRSSNERSGLLAGLCDSDTAPEVRCTDVVGSRWGSFDFYIGSRRLYIPVSLVGLVYFASVAVWFALTGPLPASAKWRWRITIAVLSSSLFGSLAFVLIMTLMLSTWCPLCVIAHCANLGIFISAWYLWGRARRADPTENIPVQPERSYDSSAPPRYAVFAVVIAMLGGFLTIAYYDSTTEVRRQWRKLGHLKRSMAAMANDRDLVHREYFAQPVVHLPKRSNNSGASLVKAPVNRVVIFSNYTCRGCSCFESWRENVIAKSLAGPVQIDYRLVPRITNPNQQQPGQDVTKDHGYLHCSAAEAARVQGGDTAFAAIHQLLFDQRKGLSSNDLDVLAKTIGLNVERFRSDLASVEVRRLIGENQALADMLGVQTVPAVFLNGRRVPEICVTSRVFWASVDEATAWQRTRTAEARLMSDG